MRIPAREACVKPHLRTRSDIKIIVRHGHFVAFLQYHKKYRAHSKNYHASKTKIIILVKLKFSCQHNENNCAAKVKIVPAQ